ncbi:hypothetical protein CBR_g9202 [Chara braunii]|uniref:NADH:ubiquinone oxidoreductase intermediate-associated protein 30 domain-containing protein n=1 Tax=Chara braunii TaxID=69332 RepID=A0A388KPC7_CHABU|nr:hypothetical protein CBR_g9202 [Chara braunii]|eukprot:GBG71793.1 hypothetical protein CBR_g9202 [Chara braunii]
MAARYMSPVMAMMAALFVATVLSAASSASAGGAPPKVSIRGLTFAGTGCSWSDSNYAFSNNYQTVTFIFGGLVATTDSGLAGRRKFCQLSFYLDYPNGWSFTLGQVTGRGFASIGKGSKGVYETQFYFSGQTGTPTVRRTIYGKQEGNFEFTDKFLTFVYSQCNSAPNLNIKSVVRVEGKKAVIGLDSSDTKFQLKFACIWKKC